MIPPRFLARFIIAQSVFVWTILASGCASVSFYTQAIAGHMQLLNRRRPIEKVVQDPDTEPTVRGRLKLVQSVRDFARDRLELPVGKAYDTYVETGRRYVVWNVFAAPEFSVEMKKFCYPVVGCLAYKGFYDESDARRAAGRLREKGYDVFVGGVVAYSTLGWFDDPVIDTFFARGDVRLAALLFHELAHKALFVGGDTRFNEGFATTVEREALKQWLAHIDDESAFEDYLASERRRQQVIALIVEAREELGGLYAAGGVSEAERRAVKKEIIGILKDAYRSLRRDWGGHDEFEHWMASDINNAAIGSIGAYHDLVPAFEAILARENHDIPAFVEACRALARLGEQERQHRLNPATPGIR